MLLDEKMLTAPELRKFGFVMAAVIGFVFGFFLPWLWSFNYPLWPWLVALPLVLAAVAMPLSLAPVLRGWMKIAEPIGRFNTALLLILMFVLMILPIALLMKLINRDALNRSKDPALETYRIASVRQPPEKLEKPF